MPLSKNAFFRLRVIDSCLRQYGHRWKLKDITDKVNRAILDRFGEAETVSESLIRKDLDDIEYRLDAPLERYPEGRPRYYRYSDSDYSLFQTAVKIKDLPKLQRAAAILGTIKGLSLAEELQPVLHYLQNRVATSENRGSKSIEFDHQPVSEGSEMLEILMEYIQNKIALKINYLSYSSGKCEPYHLHPYLLKEYNNRWFCIGYCSQRKRIVHLALDSIKGKLEVLKKGGYIENTFFNPDTYFDDIIGITRPANKEKANIRIRVASQRAQYLLTKPLHKSQRLAEKSADLSVILEIEVIPNRELISTLLSFGKDIKVLRPTSLHRELRMARYQ